jgi:peptidoglycan L-alanyl-D-glutamate endopeptidase CwlK
MNKTKIHNSRAIEDLDPILIEVWNKASEEWNATHEWKVFLTQTHRSTEYQNLLFAQGRQPLEQINSARRAMNLQPITQAENKIVTNAKGGLSKHNVYPSKAFDCAFKKGKEVSWDVEMFQEFAKLMPSHVIIGGNFKKLKDWPHFEIK